MVLQWYPALQRIILLSHIVLSSLSLHGVYHMESTKWGPKSYPKEEMDNSTQLAEYVLNSHHRIRISGCTTARIGQSELLIDGRRQKSPQLQ